MKTIDTLALVDDDETYQFIAKHTIVNLNIVDKLKIFSNGREAIDFLRTKLHDPAQLPDVILLDLNMPVMDGWQFLEHYLMLQPRIGKKIHIYIVTSSVDPVDLERADRINAVTDYFVKPLTKEKLISILESIV